MSQQKFGNAKVLLDSQIYANSKESQLDLNSFDTNENAKINNLEFYCSEKYKKNHNSL